MEEFLEFVLSNQTFRAFIAFESVKVFLLLFGKKASDPAFAAQAQAAATQYEEAKTDQEKNDAQDAIRSLMAS